MPLIYSYILKIKTNTIKTNTKIKTKIARNYFVLKVMPRKFSFTEVINLNRYSKENALVKGIF